MEMDAPLDFESEDPLLSSPVALKKRKKIIGLDDLLTDHYKDKCKLVEKEAKLAKKKKKYDSDDDDFGKEAVVTQVVDQCQNKMNQLGGEEDTSIWGLVVFGEQKPPPALESPELESCQFLQTFLNSEVNSLVNLTVEKGAIPILYAESDQDYRVDKDKEKLFWEGDAFLEGLLVNGWLSTLVSLTGRAEKSLAIWTFNLMLYSSREDLRTSACDFWKDIMLTTNEVGQHLQIDWFPNYAQLGEALETYGYRFECSLNPGLIHTGSGRGGPPQNIRAWIKFITICCQTKNKKNIFTSSEVERLAEAIICLFLDRQFQGITELLCECLQSLIHYFTDEEWNACCEKIAKSLVCRIPMDLNCLRAVECISGVDPRSKYLRSTVAYQILLFCFKKEYNDRVGGLNLRSLRTKVTPKPLANVTLNAATNEEEVLRVVTSITVKDKNCDLFKLYIYLVLTENWLVGGRTCEGKPLTREMWGLFLRNCSCQIASTDLRSYASKVNPQFITITLHRQDKCGLKAVGRIINS
uniref:Coiled-coil SMC6 And NSE5 INteracting (CANIN) domain-containing protein n=1 Tax=Cucumis melo TaxID=3656 RepID=A0A9I9CKE4_CUCME